MITKPLAIAVALAFGACVALPASAEEDEITTDRPDFVESAQAVGKGRVQVETSVAFEKDETPDGTTRAYTTPTLVRVGFADDWELRYETEGWIRERFEDRAGDKTWERGRADAALGLKWHSHDGDARAGRPDIAWLLHADLASGQDPFKGKGVRPSLRAVFEWELPGDMGVGVMPGLRWDQTAEGKRFFSGILAATVSKGWTDNFRSFAELSCRELRSPKYGGNQVTFDAGVTYLITKTMQVDLAGAWGINDRAPDFAATVGFSIKF